MFDIADIQEANKRLLGKTNRTIVFMRVNNDEYLDQDRPEEERSLPTPSLSKLLPFRKDMEPGQFIDRVRDELTVSSFSEFLDRFQPGFYYGIQGGAQIEASRYDEVPMESPRLIFAMEAHAGLRKVRITEAHPWLQRVDQWITRRGRVNAPSSHVHWDASLLSWRPLDDPDRVYKVAGELRNRFQQLQTTVRSNDDNVINRQCVQRFDEAAAKMEAVLEEIIPLLPLTVFDARTETLSESQADTATESVLPQSQSDSAPPRIGELIRHVNASRRSSGQIANLLCDMSKGSGPASPTDPASQPSGADRDSFLQLYAYAVEDFFAAIKPLFEQILAIRLLFNEISEDAQIPAESRPQIIFANDYAADILENREQELQAFIQDSNAQAANYFADAISFAVIPRAAPFSRPRSRRRARPMDTVDPELFAEINRAQRNVAIAGRHTSLTPVAEYDTMETLMDWGYQYGFQILFSAEEATVAGRTSANDLKALRQQYALEDIVKREQAETAVLCVPDYEIIPKDGKLVTGRAAGKFIEIGVNVPEIVIPGCFIGAGRLIANEITECIKYRSLLQPPNVSRPVNLNLPGAAIDLGECEYLRSPNLPAGGFLPPSVLETLCSPLMPFAVFTPLPGLQASGCAARTLRREPEGADERFRPLPLLRQQRYLDRLLRIAYKLGGGGALAQNAATDIANAIQKIIDDPYWRQPLNAVNHFPGTLDSKNSFVVKRIDANSFQINLQFNTWKVYDLTTVFI